MTGIKLRRTLLIGTEPAPYITERFTLEHVKVEKSLRIGASESIDRNAQVIKPYSVK